MAKRFAAKKSFRRYGWVPGNKAPCPFFNFPHMAVFPSSFNRRNNSPPIYAQGNLVSSTAMAAAALPHSRRIKQNLPSGML